MVLGGETRVYGSLTSEERYLWDLVSLLKSVADPSRRCRCIREMRQVCWLGGARAQNFLSMNRAVEMLVELLDEDEAGSEVQTGVDRRLILEILKTLAVLVELNPSAQDRLYVRSLQPILRTTPGKGLTPASTAPKRLGMATYLPCRRTQDTSARSARYWPGESTSAHGRCT